MGSVGVVAVTNKPGTISAKFAKRTGSAVRWVESQRKKKSTPAKYRNDRGRGYIPIEWVLLTADLLPNAIASGTLLVQAEDPNGDGSAGGWTTAEGDDATVKVYAKHLTGSMNLIPSGQKLASGCVVAVVRNPRSGLRNLLQSTCCPVAAS